MVKKHNFFQNLDWVALESKLLDPPIKPMTHNEGDTCYFNLVKFKHFYLI